jgi:uncharacterized membrane protein
MADSVDLMGGVGKLDTPGLGDVVGGSSNKELMAETRMTLSGNWGLAIVGYVLFSVLIGSIGLFMQASIIFTGATGSSSSANLATLLFSVVFLLISGPLTVGYFSFFLGIAQDGEAKLESLFSGFKRFLASFGVHLLSGIFVFLWSLLLVVPGIIAAYRYAMVYFIVADDEDVGPLEAIGQSKEMMKGNKWKLFCLQWRFFWWMLLCSVLPIGYLWLVPYMQTSFAKFYEDVK